MHPDTKKEFHKYRYLIIGLSLALLIVITALWAYLINSQDPVSRFVKSIYPAAIVDGEGISLNEYDTAHNIALKFDSETSNGLTMDQLVQTHREEALLRKLDVTVNPNLVTNENAYLNSAENGQYTQVLQKYFNGNQKDFERFIAWPRVLDSQLRIKYNLDSKSNTTDYTRAQSILNEIKNGKKFEDVAKLESADKVTAQLGGDLGFVKPQEILPELAEDLTNLKVGEVFGQVVVSRLGYHILFLDGVSEQNGEKLYHLKHILITTQGFDSWLQPQLDRISVWRIK